MLFLRRLCRVLIALTGMDYQSDNSAQPFDRPHCQTRQGNRAGRLLWSVEASFAMCLVCLPQLSILLAQTERTVPASCDLPTCIQLALARHPDLQGGEARKLAAQSKVEFEKAQWKPQLDFNGEGGYLNGKSVDPFALLRGVTAEGQPQGYVSGGYYNASVALNVPIVKEGKIFGVNSPSIRRARFTLSAEENLQVTRREQIIYRVTAAFINVVKALEMVKSQEQIVLLAESQYRLALSQFTQELISRNALLTAEVQQVTAQRDLLTFKNVLDQSRGDLARSIGLEFPTMMEMHDPAFPPLQALPLPPSQEVIAFAYEHRPEILAQQAQIAAQEQEVKRLQGERFPTLKLKSEYTLGDAADSRSTFGSAYQWTAIAQLSGPIFDFGRYEQKINVSKALLTEEVKKMESLRVSIAGEIQGVYSNLANMRTLLDLTGKQIEQATEALKLNRARFEQQLLSESSVAEAQITLLKLEQAKALASYDLILGYSQLELATGGWKARTP
jgi:outer membrane protein TolC